MENRHRYRRAKIRHTLGAEWCAWTEENRDHGEAPNLISKSKRIAYTRGDSSSSRCNLQAEGRGRRGEVNWRGMLLGLITAVNHGWRKSSNLLTAPVVRWRTVSPVCTLENSAQLDCRIALVLASPGLVNCGQFSIRMGELERHAVPLTSRGCFSSPVGSHARAIASQDARARASCTLPSPPRSPSER